MEKRWVVELSEEERERLKQLIHKGNVIGYKIRHAHMLLKADEGAEGPAWSDKQIADAYHTSVSTVRNLRKRLVEKGFEAALEREKQAKRKSKWDGEMEAKLIAIACSKPPEGYSRWSVRLLAHHVVELEIIESISHTAVHQIMKKTNLNRG